jgi:hypothetical protein
MLSALADAGAFVVFIQPSVTLHQLRCSYRHDPGQRSRRYTGRQSRRHGFIRTGDLMASDFFLLCSTELSSGLVPARSAVRHLQRLNADLLPLTRPIFPTTPNSPIPTQHLAGVLCLNPKIFEETRIFSTSNWPKASMFSAVIPIPSLEPSNHAPKSLVTAHTEGLPCWTSLQARHIETTSQGSVSQQSVGTCRYLGPGLSVVHLSLQMPLRWWIVNRESLLLLHMSDMMISSSFLAICRGHLADSRCHSWLTFLRSLLHLTPVSFH